MIDDERKVLRAVYLGSDLDERLRIAAYHFKKSKNDLMTEAINRYLIELEIYKEHFLNEGTRDQDI